MPAPQRPGEPRKIPNFKARHLDPHRARQLKKEWLATQKIKAAYRAEKRRLGLRKSADSDAQRSSTAEVNGTAAEAQPPDEHISEPSASDRSSIGGDYDSHPIVKDARAIKGQGEFDTARRKGEGKNKGKEKSVAPAQSAPVPPSLREMAREAYSPASLHTHKSKPLHKRQHGKDHARRRVEAATARGGRGVTNGRGRGQPDMAKRMGVLLEKIKRAM
ncbi:hypothetical protein FRC08_013885 [Ceratobasidium sp. 394]|nr:hypothetical protein FRC08_013885 [Ceratobasidium sp. 394]KAG9102041.1 hypothetical protein FS749_000075 [Ceratobasidium sp. UAMH 11750]